MKTDEILHYFAKYIEAEVGIIYSEHNYFQLQNRLEEIAKLNGIPNLEIMYQKCQLGFCNKFKQTLLDLATNNETSFFRDPKVFRAMENIIVRLSSENKSRPEELRIWSAASSTGQEAISTAILINEYNEKMNTSIRFSITGTDVSERVLAKAKDGRYSQLEVQRGLAPQMLQKYFLQDEDNQWVASPMITKNIKFNKINLKDSFSFNENFHLILCRNVLIYQNVDAKMEILSKITSFLASGGFLILGSGESLVGLSAAYEQVFDDGAVVYRKN